jgi:hypothetical protein
VSAPFEPLDHGVLNVPLHRRGDIDRQLDRHLANERPREEARGTRAGIAHPR